MANVNSFQVTNDTPVASHGMGGDVKVARFQVPMPATANLDTIAFGQLPSYAVPIEVIMHGTAAHASLDVGITGDADGFFDNAALAANVPLRTALSTLIGKNVGIDPVNVVGLSNGVGAAGTLNLIVFYIVEDQGVAYTFVAAV